MKINEKKNITKEYKLNEIFNVVYEAWTNSIKCCFLTI